MRPLDPFDRRRQTGEPVPLALGTMNFGKRTDEATSVRIIHAAVERGVALFDTANAYVNGESERVLGRALRGRREGVLVASKVGFGRVAGRPEGLRPERVVSACEESLARLGMDYLDLYYLHVPDHTTPLEETLSAVRGLLQTGKIRAFGVSNYASWQLVEMNHLCDREGMPRPVISQTLYNLLIRQLDLEYASFLRHHPVHNTVYNALAGGLLSGRYKPGDAVQKGSRFDDNKLYQGRYWSERFFQLVEAYRAIAAEEGVSLLELAYAWLAQSPLVDSLLVGPATLEQLDAALLGTTRALSRDTLARIDRTHLAFLGTETSYAR
jgi:aryl-alcohol dehydrogenase-like predicted oxidoreductase